MSASLILLFTTITVGINKFACMALPHARLHSHPLQLWLRMTYTSPADLFKLSLSPQNDRSHTLVVLICTMTQANALFLSQGNFHNKCLDRGNRGHMNNLSFKGKYPGKKPMKTNMNLLELYIVWKAVNSSRRRSRGR